MESWHSKFALLQDLSTQVLACLESESPAQADISERMEDVKDRWDCLVQIIEAQSLRVSGAAAAWPACHSACRRACWMWRDERGGCGM